MASCAAHNAVDLPLPRWSAAVVSGAMRLRARGCRIRQRQEAQQLIVTLLMAARKASLLDGCPRWRRKCCWSLLPAGRVGMGAWRQWRLRLLTDRGGSSGAGPKAAAGRSCWDDARQRGMMLLPADWQTVQLVTSNAVAVIVFVTVAAAGGLGAEGRRPRLLSGPRVRLRWRNGRGHAVPREVAAAAASPIDRVNVCVGVCVGQSRAGEGKGKGSRCRR